MKRRFFEATCPDCFLGRIVIKQPHLSYFVYCQTCKGSGTVLAEVVNLVQLPEIKLKKIKSRRKKYATKVRA